MNTTAKGSAAERYVARWLQERGWLVASRRHIGGAGDLLAVWPGLPGPFATPSQTHPSTYMQLFTGVTWLLEVKACKELWQQFRREDRQAMRDTPLPPGGERWVVNKRGKELIWVHEKDWPPNDHRVGKPDQKDIERGQELAEEHGWP